MDQFGGWSSMGGGGVSDWDLQAVVRGYFSPAPVVAPEVDVFAGLSSFLLDDAGVHGRGDGIEPSMDLTELPASSSYASDMHELEEMYKPFFFSGQPTPAPAPVMARPQRPVSQAARSKRRKSQAKKEVCHVPAEGLAADKWAWRKYGQKPIKGSPYPRGYYRCSTSKACPAKKQVERSCTDPTMFVITYTAEHNHAAPTHRNSLAGSTRQKFATPPSSVTQQPAASPSANTSVEEEENEEGCSHTGKQEDGSEEYGEEEFMFPSDDMFMEFTGGSPGGVLDSWFSDSSPIDFSDNWFAGVGDS